MTIIELGARIREAREDRHWTVADVSDALKIPSRILKGIEEGSDSLPRTVYVFHFIKDYAKHVGFSSEEVTAMTSSLEGFDKVVHPLRDATLQFTPVRPSPIPKVLGAALKLALFVALGFGGYNAYLHFFAERDAHIVAEQKSAQQTTVGSTDTSPWNVPSSGDRTGASAQQRASSAETAGISPSPAAKEAPSSPSADAKPSDLVAGSEGNGGDQSQQVAQEGKITLPPEPAPNWNAPAAAPLQSTFVTAAAAQDPAAPHPAYLLGQEQPPASEGPSANAASSAELQPVPEGMHQVVILADMGDCWMGFEPDGKKQQRMLRKGDSLAMTFRDALQLRLGNASAVRITYDGRELDRSTAAKPVNMSFPQAQ